MKVIYVAGPYRAPTEDRLFRNIMDARAAAYELWCLGWAVICPHTNTMFMGGLVGRADDAFIDGDCEIVKRCNAVFMLRKYKQSTGAVRELDIAKQHGLEIYFESDGYPEP